MTDRFRGCLAGLAAGDAVGTAAESQPRGSFVPLTGMTGGGPYRLQPGQWTDDTSMALCLGISLVKKGGFHALDQMERYARWAKTGYLSSTGTCFGMGGTVRASLDRFTRTRDPFSGPKDPWTAGNGSIMRLAPIPIFYYPDLEKAGSMAEKSSRTTHGTRECLDACRLMARIIVRIFKGRSRQEAVLGDNRDFSGSPGMAAIAQGEYLDKTRDQIRGTAYVVDSLEAALWCFMRTGSFEQAILEAANLGDDADTTAAVCGQIAGAYYGLSGIPGTWIEKLTMGPEIIDLADALARG
ncbi:ADP-ribosylglycohydrolase family protein [Desulfonatronovibrio hydrogenovorans]|uniref:ADP-ribosylglycohydrolase family protein n=1 Tax=Desulfonatronovibrio hydrogenovorans TaxID=53245 RepID=UPI001ABF658F|nr:ADP-ribosylglycohydrolase family protein [Desulfonatronovibrio hydrogenovorans]